MAFPIHSHMLRRGCGYALANARHDTRAIQAWMGHKNIRHTVRYTEGARSIQGFLAGLTFGLVFLKVLRFNRECQASHTGS
jgi:hypothetical protein